MIIIAGTVGKQGSGQVTTTPESTAPLTGRQRGKHYHCLGQSLRHHQISEDSQVIKRGFRSSPVAQPVKDPVLLLLLWPRSPLWDGFDLELLHAAGVAKKGEKRVCGSFCH